MIPPPASSTNEVGAPHLYEDTLVGLIFGRLAKEDRGRALVHLRSCPECENLFQRRASEVEHLRSSPVYLAPMRYVSLPEQTADPGSARVSMADGRSADARWAMPGTALRGLREGLRQPRLFLGTAAVVATMVMVVLVLVRSTDRVSWPSEIDWLPGGSEFTQTRAEEAISSGESSYDADARITVQSKQAILRAIEAYSRRDLDAAIQGLRSAKTAGPLESIRQIYLANALAHQGHLAEAVTALRSVLQTDLPQDWRDQARWSLLLSLHRAGRRASADSLLKVMAVERDEFGNRARSLLSHHGSKEQP